jgi:hypothetical protein
MSHSLHLLDRIRIEWAVWSLDQRLYELPRRSRIGKRRELRANLKSAADDIGTSEALRRLGDSHRLAEGYLTAELGDAPRPSWLAAGVFLMGFPLVFMSIITDAALAFGDGIKAANPNATGTFTWSGIGYLQSEVTYRFANGDSDYVGGAMTPLCWLLLIVATILVGRLWRIPFAWWRRRFDAARATT